MQLASLNKLPEVQAHEYFMQCCSSERWVERMVAERPFSDSASIQLAADKHWQDLDEADYLQAFDGHPKIGDVNSLKAKYSNTQTLASNEQSGVNQADDNTIEQLAKGNALYEEKFGFIFIVCASGKSATQMLGLLRARLNNERTTELQNAAEEQRKIFQIRINTSLTEESS